MQSKTLLKMLVPFCILLTLLVILFMRNYGLQYASEPKDELLMDDASYKTVLQGAEESADASPYRMQPILVLADNAEVVSITLLENLTYTLDRMRLPYTVEDVTAFDDIPLNEYTQVIVTFPFFEHLAGGLFTLCDWVRAGGSLLFAAQPEWSIEFTTMAAKLGVINESFSYDSYSGIRFVTDFMPCVEGRSFSADSFGDVFMPMRLLNDGKTISHVVTNDAYAVPLLWERDYGEGRFIVNNNPLFRYAANYGYIASVISLLGDSCAYAVINGSAVFIDDFPAPVAQGYDERLYAQYGTSISEFYDSVWWADMLAFAEKYGLRYTGLLVETYNNQVEPPFTPEGGLNAYIIAGRKLFSVNGEIGYHGYNHQSLVLSGFDYEGELDYRKYASTDSMAAALLELARFGDELFPGYAYTVYVPPSNVLSEEARALIAQRLPQVRVISGTSASDSPVYYVQDFDVGEDGIINVPRVSSGAMPDPLMDWRIYNELAMRFCFSHFVHPDDVLDEERGALLGWETLRSKLGEYFELVDALGLRQMTASDLGGAVQRYCALRFDMKDTGDRIEIYCHGLLDAGWMLLRVRGRAPVSVTGGELSAVTSELYLLRADGSRVTITLARR